MSNPDGDNKDTPPAPSEQNTELQAQIDNLNKALKESRQEAKALKEAEEKREAENIKKQEEAKKKKWEFEKLYTEQTETLNSLTDKSKTQEEQITQFNTFFQEDFANKTKDLKKEQKELVEKLLDGKTDFEKATLVWDILSQFSTGGNFGQTPEWWNTPPKVDESKELLKKWDVQWSLALRLANK